MLSYLLHNLQILTCPVIDKTKFHWKSGKESLCNKLQKFSEFFNKRIFTYTSRPFQPFSASFFELNLSTNSNTYFFFKKKLLAGFLLLLKMAPSVVKWCFQHNTTHIISSQFVSSVVFLLIFICNTLLFISSFAYGCVCVCVFLVFLCKCFIKRKYKNV